MAVGALIPLILGGGLALQDRERRRAEGQRQTLADAFQAQLGNVAIPGQQATLFNDQGLSEGQLSGVGAVQGSGILGSVQDPVLQQQIQSAGSLFATPGGEDMGRSMLQTALASQQAQRQQQNLFGQQDASQERQFEQQTEENRLSREQTDLHHKERILEQRRVAAEERRIAAEQFARQNSIAGTPSDPNMQRIQNPNGAPGEFIDVPKMGTPVYEEAAFKVDELAAQVERMDDMIQLFDKIGTNEFGAEGGELKSKYTAAKLNMKNVFGLGVLSADDERLLTDVMQDPNGFDALITGDETIKAGYMNALHILQRSLRSQNQKYKNWGINSTLDETTPSQQKALDLEMKQAEEAARLGLTPGRAPLLSAQNPPNRNVGETQFNYYDPNNPIVR